MKVTKINSFLEVLSMMYLCQFGKTLARFSHQPLVQLISADKPFSYS